MNETRLLQSKWIICRICLKSSTDEMLKIFDGANLELVSKIEECGGVVLNTAPNLPDSICLKCLTLLKAATKFRERVQKSQAELSEKFTQKDNYDIREECDVLITENTTAIDENEDQKAINTEMIIPDESLDAEPIESLVYSVEYQNAQPDIIRVDGSTALEDTSSDVLNHNDKFFAYVDQDIDDLELNVVLNAENENDTSCFKIVPQFSTTTTARTKQLPPIRQRKRKAEFDVENTEMNHICPYCGNSYCGKAKLSLHMKIHAKEKPHQCEICFKRFGQTPQLARHMNSHTGSRPFVCKYCPASFADPSTRIKHERIHTNERPYQCTVCEKAFSYSNVLKVHMMTHTGEKPHNCKYCGKQFSQAHHKKKHERLHEKTSLKLAKTDEETKDIIKCK